MYLQTRLKVFERNHGLGIVPKVLLEQIGGHVWVARRQRVAALDGQPRLLERTLLGGETENALRVRCGSACAIMGGACESENGGMVRDEGRMMRDEKSAIIGRWDLAGLYCLRSGEGRIEEDNGRVNTCRMHVDTGRNN